MESVMSPMTGPKLTLIWAIMKDFYMQHSPDMSDNPNLMLILFGYLILALIMSYIFPKGQGSGGAIGEGLRFGMLMGLIWTLPHGIVVQAAAEKGILFPLADSLWHMVEQGVGGIIMALIYGKKS